MIVGVGDVECLICGTVVHSKRVLQLCTVALAFDIAEVKKISSVLIGACYIASLFTIKVDGSDRRAL